MSDVLTRLNAALSHRYRVERQLGEGGMATVYLARDLRHDRDVALKVLREDLAAGIGPDRFLEEVRITAKLRHPHILPLFDSGEVDGLLFYVMPFVSGESLKARLARERELPIADAARILRDVVDGLAAAHEAGVIHRDVKPANILLDGRHAVVADFGIAKAVTDARAAGHLTTMGTSLGTPKYMSPEQAAGDEAVDHRSDVYSVGAVAYELLAGRPPFDAASHRQVLMAHITQAPDAVTDHRPGVPAELAHAVMRCLEKKPADRWQRVDELLPFLDAVAVDSGVHRTSADRRRRGSPRHRWTMAAAAVAAVAVVGLGVRSVLDAGDAMGSQDAEEGAVAAREEWTGLRLAIANPQNLTEDAAWDYLAAAVEEEMRQAVARHAPGAEVLSRRTFDDASMDGREVVDVARGAGATHLIESRYTLDPTSVTVVLDVVDARSGELVRSLDPVRVPLDSVETAVRRAGDGAAIAAMYLVSDEGDDVEFRYTTLPRTPLGASYYLSSTSAFRETRDSDAVDWTVRLQELEPDLPGPYLNIRGPMNNAGRGAEWTAERDSMAQVMLRRATPFERDYYLLLFGPTRGDRIEAAERVFRLTGGRAGTGYALAFRAINANELSLAREALDAQDFGEVAMRDWTPLWLLDAVVSHLEEDYESEILRAQEGLRLPQGRCLGVFSCESQLLQAQARSLAALAQADSAMVLFRRLQAMPGNRHTLWEILHNIALELRRHGRQDVASEAFRELAAWAEAQDLEPLDRASSFYGAAEHGRAVELLLPMFAEDGSWAGPEEVEQGDRVIHAALLVMSLEAVGQAEQASRYEEVLTSLPRGSRDLGRRWVALVYASRHDVEGAVRELEAAFDDTVHYFHLSSGPDRNLFLHNRPELEKIRDDPRFQRLMEPR